MCSRRWWRPARTPAAIVEAKGLRQVTDTGAIDAAVDEVLAANADKVAEYRSGKDKLFGFFVGQVMKATAGKANPGAGQRDAEARAVIAIAPASWLVRQLRHADGQVVE